jgi:hypothetical protein
MGITVKDLMQPPKFEGLGKFVYSRAGNDDWPATFTFEFFGGQLSVEVEEEELLNPPVVGSMFFISGDLRRNSRNGTISLAATGHKFVASSSENLSSEQMDQYVRGLSIRGVGVVEDKQSVVMGRQPAYLSAMLKWQGATHQFKKLPPELFQRIPGKGSYVRFELSMRVREERSREGQMIMLQIPFLESVTLDKLESGSVSGVSSAAVPPVKPVAAPAGKV